jgi:hypothetical protein
METDKKTCKKVEMDTICDLFDLLYKIDCRLESECESTLLNGNIQGNEKRKRSIH